MKEFVYKEVGKRERIDVYLKNCLGVSRAKIQELIKDGRVQVNGVELKVSYYLRDNDIILVEETIDSLKPLKVEPQKGFLSILYEDSHIIVLNKPSGLVTHPVRTGSEETLLNYILFHTLLVGGGSLRPGVVHRLDKDTSGVILFTKTEFAYENIVAQFKSRQVEKEYIALVKGSFSSPLKEVEMVISKDKREPLKMEEGFLRGKKSITRLRAVGYMRDKNISLVKAEPITGRTHQIRLVLSSLGFPIIGDKKYGVLSPLISRVGLHSSKISLIHPENGSRISFSAPLPTDMLNIVNTEILKEL